MSMTRRLLRQVESPPVWLLALIALAWGQREYLPLLPVPAVFRGLGLGLVLLGAGLMAAAFVPFARLRTTILPREVPGRLITTGVYRVSRNPIYLADVLILAGAVLAWDLGSLPLVPLLVAVLQMRFIRGEEAGCARAFGADWTAYAGRVRRWI